MPDLNDKPAEIVNSPCLHGLPRTERAYWLIKAADRALSETRKLATTIDRGARDEALRDYRKKRLSHIPETRAAARQLVQDIARNAAGEWRSHRNSATCPNADRDTARGDLWYMFSNGWLANDMPGASSINEHRPNHRVERPLCPRKQT